MKSERRILIINDEPDMLDQMKRWLSIRTSQIDCVLTGQEGLGLARRKHYDYIFLDYHLKRDKEGETTAAAFIPKLKSLDSEMSLFVVSATARDLSAEKLGVERVLLVDSTFWEKLINSIIQEEN